eukprot:2532002-Amphidinium_carterae.2
MSNTCLVFASSFLPRMRQVFQDVRRTSLSDSCGVVSQTSQGKGRAPGKFTLPLPFLRQRIEVLPTRAYVYKHFKRHRAGMAGHSGERAARLCKASATSRFKTVFERGSLCPDTNPRMKLLQARRALREPARSNPEALWARGC